MSHRLTRRGFLKMSAMAAAASVVSGCTANLQRTEYLESYVRPPEEGLPGENLWYASTCRQCSAGCGIIVRVSEGRARKIEGNPLHPVNRGKLCARGQAALQELYDPDRLRNAVQQTGGRGSQQFEPLYWEDALKVLVERLRAADPAAVAFLCGTPSTHLSVVVRRFLEALGAPPPVIYTLGDELEGRQALTQASQQLFDAPALPMFDIANADVVFSFGANFLETWLSPVSYSRAYAQMRRRPLGKRGYMVQFEPRLSSTAASADEWVPVRPGTEGLAALALGKIILDQELGREAQHAPLYEKVDIAEVAEASGIPAEELERLARVFASVPSQVAIPGGVLAAHHNGTAALTAVQALNLILARVGQPGGVFLPAEATVEGFTPSTSHRGELVEPSGHRLPPASTFADVQALMDRMAAGQVQMLLIHGANPVFELPTMAGFAEALAQVPFVVSFSSIVDETAVQADLILPDHTNLEGWGYHVPPIADRLVVSGQQPVMRSLYDTRATVDVLLALAQQLGGSLSQALPWPNEVEFLKEMTGGWRDEGTSTEAFWSAWRRRGGWWSEEARRALQVGGALDEALTLAAPTFEGDPAEYPFHLQLYPSISLFDGRGANKSWLQETPDPMTTVAWQTWIEINPHTAERLGVKDNDVVRVSSPAGEVQAIVYVYPGIQEDVVAMPVGQGHEHGGRYARGQGSNPIQLLVPAVVGDTGALAWAATRVQIVPTDRRHALARLESPEGIEYLREGH
jgi:anaerobic selenocysteine-containing dehydrogenase